MKANKALGQNFLIDKNIIRKIVDSAMHEDITKIIEVGPGTGALTSELISREGKEITAIEIDDNLYEYLVDKYKDQDNLELVLGNILDKDISELSKGEKFSLVANLPYYISSRIIFKFLYDDNCESMTIMLQKELVDRIMSNPKTKEYGRLTVAIKSFYTPQRVVNVPPTCFKPRPKVHSAVVKLVKLEENGIENKDEYLEFIKRCFNQKRKTLRNNLRSYYPMEEIEKNLSKLFTDDWDFIRSEYVKVSEFKKLHKLFSNI